MQGLKEAAEILCAATRNGDSREEVFKKLEAKTYYADPEAGMFATLHQEALYGIRDKIRATAGSTWIVAGLQEARANAERLALDPVRDPTGELYIGAKDMPQSCGAVAHKEIKSWT